MAHSLSALSSEVQALTNENARLQESITDMAMRMEDVNWTLLLGDQLLKEGPSLDDLRIMSEPLRDMASGNPLMKRGAQLRHSYVFGRGVVLSGVKPAAQKIMDDLYNKSVLFAVSAYETMNLALYTDGNLFTIYDERDKSFIVVPLSQITAVQTHVDDATRIQYIRREWSANGTAYKRWYPLNKYKESGVRLLSEIETGGMVTPVSKTGVIFHHYTNKQAGWTFGIPDSFAAALWAKAYSEYLNDNKKLVKALSQFAWKVTQNTRAGVTNAAAKVAQRTGDQTGGTAVMAAGADLSAIPRAGSDVNFNNGQPLAAMIAASLGVSVIALIASPGAAGGSYGAAATLDFPTIRVMQSVQDSWIVFFREVLITLRSPKAEVSFPSIETDPVYRELAVMAQMVELGMLHREEGRDLALQRLDITNPKPGMPEPPEPKGGSAVPSQGNTGTGNPASDISNHDGDTD